MLISIVHILTVWSTLNIHTLPVWIHNVIQNLLQISIQYEAQALMLLANDLKYTVHPSLYKKTTVSSQKDTFYSG